MAASALICQRLTADVSDLWVLRYIWDSEEQRDLLTSIVQEVMQPAIDQTHVERHSRSRGQDAPDPERLARDIARLSEKASTELSPTERSYVRDQLGLLAGRCQWVSEAQQRQFLETRIHELWPKLGGAPS